VGGDNISVDMCKGGGEEQQHLTSRGMDNNILLGDGGGVGNNHSWAPMVKKTSIGSIPIID
jgi:hypothetical protein